MEDVFQRIADRTRARLDVPQLRRLFGARKRPHHRDRRTGPPQLAVVLETPEYDLTVFKVCITGENEQPFRSMANGNFGRSRTPISDEAEQSFRLMPNTHFG
jgi:hypothetical protein